MEMRKIEWDVEQLQKNQPITSRLPSTISENFRQMVGKLILKTRLACSLASLDAREFAAAAEAWCEVLNDVIPIERLNECYLYAMQHRSSTFPLGACELLEAWRGLAAELAARRKPVCALCGGAGFALVYDPKTDREFEKECPTCSGVTDIATFQNQKRSAAGGV